jgi:L-serine deaminase
VDLADLDAGSGSLIVQAIVAGAAGMAVAVKLYWRRLTGLFKRQPAAVPESEPKQAEAQTADRD